MNYTAILEDHKGFTKELEISGDYPRPMLELPIPNPTVLSEDPGICVPGIRPIKFRLMRMEPIYRTGPPGVPRALQNEVFVGYRAYYEEIEEVLAQFLPDPPKLRRFIDLRPA